MLFAKTVSRQGEKIITLDQENKLLNETNKELRYENEELNLFKNNIEKIINYSDMTKENYFITLEKIKKELAFSKTY